MTMISNSSSVVARSLLRRHMHVASLARPITTINKQPAFSSTKKKDRTNRLFLSDNSTLKADKNSREALFPSNNFSQSSYGSLGDATPLPTLNRIHEAVPPFLDDRNNATSASWQAQDDADVQRVTSQALIYELTRETADTIEKVVPWFLKTMPDSYFRQIPPYLRRDHVKALAAVVDADMDMYLNLKSQTSDGRTVYTFIRPTTEPGTLLSMVEELPMCDPNCPLTRLHVFSALDESFSLNMFVTGESNPRPESMQGPRPHRDAILKFASGVRNGTHLLKYPDLDPNEPLFEEARLQPYLNKCRDNYLRIISEHPERFLRQRLLFESVSGTEGCEVHIEEAIHEVSGSDNSEVNGTAKQYWLDVAVANSLPQVALESACTLLYVQGFDIARARLDVIPDDDNGSVTLLRFLIHPVEQDDGLESKLERLQYNLKRSKWLDDTTMKLVFEDKPWLGVKRGEIITAMCSLLHPILSKSDDGNNGNFYSKHNILVSPRKSIVRCIARIYNIIRFPFLHHLTNPLLLLCGFRL